MILRADRINLQPIKPSDAAFYYNLLTDKDWIANIRDSKLENIDAVEAYIKNTLIPNFNYRGLGFYVVRITKTGESIGVSTLIKREALKTVDLGYGFLPKGRGKGYAREATLRLMKYISEELQYPKVLAFTKPSNTPSQNLLIKIGFEAKGLKKVFDAEEALFEYVFK
ncbi:acetyltransferase [Polaribacter pacificus]|uniref:Acetyltransferase n=1 Tax=Polaribacter pacificus TaxID=1775173 RepID=A0A917HYY7_9FLAO|nr:GNAT family N-acetyltransferase [Polaribacter pacificus]GGG96603.1 acetyltransferase [Polaribacter pacificus]